MKNENVKRNTLEIEIDRPVGEVFAYTTDPSHTHEWVEGITHETVDTVPVQVGSVYENDFGRLVVSAFEQDSVFELTSDDGTYVVRYEYGAVNDTSTNLRYIEWHVDGSELSDPLPRTALEQLKHLVEQL